MWHKQPYPRTQILLEGNKQRQNSSGKNAMSASYCFLTCSKLGDGIFSSGIHLTCAITTTPHLIKGGRPLKVCCCSRMKGRKRQHILPPALPSFTLFSCLTINTAPETKDVHSDKAWEGVWAAGQQLGSVVPKCAVGRSSRIKITVKHLGRPLYQTDHYKGIRNLTATLELNWAQHHFPHWPQKSWQRHLGALHLQPAAPGLTLWHRGYKQELLKYSHLLHCTEDKWPYLGIVWKSQRLQDKWISYFQHAGLPHLNLQQKHHCVAKPEHHTLEKAKVLAK